MLHILWLFFLAWLALGVLGVLNDAWETVRTSLQDAKRARSAR